MTQDFSNQFQAIKQSLQTNNLAAAMEKISALKAVELPVALRIELLYLSAVTQRLANQFNQALQELSELLHLRPEHGRAYQEQAYNFLALDQQDKAASAFFRATHYNPALINSWKQLLKIYQQHQDTTAEQLALQHIAHLEQLPPPILGAYDLMYEKQLATAEKVCRQFLQQHKHHPEGMLLLAELGIQLKVYHDAEFLLESCVALYPDNLRAVIAYLGLLAKLGKHQRVVEISNEQMATYPDNLQILMAKANALLGINRTEDAITMFTELLSADEDRPGVWLALGHAYKTTGNKQQAVEAYLKAAHYHQQFDLAV